MKYTMTKFTKFASKYQPFLFSLPFVATAIMTNLNFLIGTLYAPNMLYTLINVTASAFILLWSCYTFLNLWKTNADTHKYLIKISLIALFFAACYCIAFLRYGFYSEMIRQAKGFILHGPSALIIGALLGIKKSESDFFDKAEYLSLATVLVMVNYVIMLYTNTSPFDSGGIGFLNYMHLSYAYMPILFILIIQIARGKTTFLFIKNKTKAAIVRLIFITAVWTLILGCATRGTILCVLVFMLLLGAYTAFSKLYKTTSLKTLVAAFVIIGLQFVTFTYIITPNGLNRLERVNKFTESIKEGDIETSQDAPFIKESGLDNPVNDLPLTYAVDLEKAGGPGEDERVWLVGVTIKDRFSIYTLAWKEALKRPLTGMGPFGFTAKYGNYPHNVILELFSDLGFIAGGLVLLFIIILLIKLFILSFNDNLCSFMLIFLLGYVGYLMISGTVWNHPSLIFATGYSLCRTGVKRAVLNNIGK